MTGFVGQSNNNVCRPLRRICRDAAAGVANTSTYQTLLRPVRLLQFHKQQADGLGAATTSEPTMAGFPVHPGSVGNIRDHHNDGTSAIWHQYYS